ncbi:hypothetical protein GCM10010411_53920 [Actinomadura fulvescens]|uniref:Uncharacterized protein n=1 Tax=Actinomadura fulvescens TaxID=46160 RepID=A0ABP6CEX4_9ACTN
MASSKPWISSEAAAVTRTRRLRVSMGSLGQVLVSVVKVPFSAWSAVRRHRSFLMAVHSQDPGEIHDPNLPPPGQGAKAPLSDSKTSSAKRSPMRTWPAGEGWTPSSKGSSA